MAELTQILPLLTNFGNVRYGYVWHDMPGIDKCGLIWLLKVRYASYSQV